MSYNKTTWINGDVITAVKLNNIENGLESISQSGTDRQVLGYVNGVPEPVTLGVSHLTDVGGFPSFPNGLLAATAMNAETETGLLAFIPFSETPQAGSFPLYGTNGVMKVSNGIDNNDAVSMEQYNALLARIEALET